MPRARTGCNTQSWMLNLKNGMKAPYLVFVFLALVFLAGCESRDEGSIYLGQNYVLIRLNQSVSVEDLSTAADVGIPHEVVSVGFNERFIVAHSATNGATNIWVVIKESRTILGPLSKEKFREVAKTNPAILLIQEKNAWRIK